MVPGTALIWVNPNIGKSQQDSLPTVPDPAGYWKCIGPNTDPVREVMLVNGLYIIREVDNTPGRNFVNWRYVTLSDLIMGSSWNLQAGGKGMGGGDTQTVMIKGALFQVFDAGVLSDNWLSRYASVRAAVHERIAEFRVTPHAVPPEGQPS